MHKISLFVIGVFICGSIHVFGQRPVDSGTSLMTARNKFSPLTGILGAFPEEIKLLLMHVKEKKEHVIQQINFTEGILQGKRVVVTQTGIGKVNAAITATLLIEHFQPSEIIFTGIAGGVNPDLLPGDLVIGTKIAHHDYGTLAPDSLLRRPTRNPFTMQENPLYFLCDTSLVRLSSLAGKEDLGFKKINLGVGTRSPQIILGTIVTGDVFVSSEATTLLLRKEMNADAVEMEGAAIAQVCWQQHKPFIVIRSVSDNAGNTAVTEIRNFYETAAYNSARLVMAIVQSLAQKK